MNPMDMMRLGSLWKSFQSRHPKFPKFLKAASRPGVLEEGTVIEIKIVPPNGEGITTNIKVSEKDLELLKSLGGKN